MKPVQIVALVLAGALGGAVVMKWRPESARRPSPKRLRWSQQQTASRRASRQLRGRAAQPAPRRLRHAEQPSPAAPPKPAPARHREDARAASRVSEPANQLPVSKPGQPAAGPAASPAPRPAPVEPPAPRAPTTRAANRSTRSSGPRAAAEPAPQVTLNAGMLIPVRLVDGLSSERNAPGDTFTATLDKSWWWTVS